MPSTPQPEAFYATAFGLLWKSPVPLPLFAPSQAQLASDITVAISHLPAPPCRPGTRGNVHPYSSGFCYADTQVTLCTNASERINIYPAPDWDGVLPASFFSTVTALLLAERGLLPIHGSAVEWEGGATLICGAAGAGKSTYAAEMIARGAKLLSDDLTVLHVDARSGAAKVYAGRTTMRLHPEAASKLGAAVCWVAEPYVADGKLAVSPPRVAATVGIPLRRIILLGESEAAVSEAGGSGSLLPHVFRPKWMRRVPGNDRRRAALAIASRHCVVEHKLSILRRDLDAVPMVLEEEP